MIDAYEIGIQLALQDGVSAGLEVINRELADVDRAIAATSAGLVQLTRAAETAGRTVAAATRLKMPALGAAAQDEAVPAGSTEAATLHKTADQGASVTPVATMPATMTELPQAGGSRQPAAPDGGAVSETKSAPQAAERAVSLPGRFEVPAAPVILNQSLEAASAPVGSVAVERSVDAAPVLPQPSRMEAPRAASQAAPRALQPLAAAPTAPTRGPVTASIAHALPPKPGPLPAAGRSTEPEAQRPDTRSSPTPQTAAPWPGAEPRTSSPKAQGSLERGTAPQPQSRAREEGGGGTVMLDGRLVGHWLSEQMAREASRPPSGTSFFDTRQTPAWSASGAL